MKLDSKVKNGFLDLFSTLSLSWKLMEGLHWWQNYSRLEELVSLPKISGFLLFLFTKIQADQWLDPSLWVFPLLYKYNFRSQFFTHSLAISYSILTLLINRNSSTFQALSYDILHFLVYHLSSILFAWPPMNVKSCLRFKR